MLIDKGIWKQWSKSESLQFTPIDSASPWIQICETTKQLQFSKLTKSI